MNFFIIPYLLAVDVMVPPIPFEEGPSFDFNISVDSTTKLADSSEKSSHSKLTTIMYCSHYLKKYRCIFENTTVIHEQNTKDLSSPQVFDGSRLAGISLITNETIDLEFEKTGVKITSSKEESERSLRMIQKIIDLLHVGVTFDGKSRLETVDMVDDCPVTTRANFQSIRQVTRKPGVIFLKLVSDLNNFDENSEWVLKVNKTKDMKNCRNHRDYFFGSGGANDVTHGSRITSDITSSYNNIEMTDTKLISIGHTEGTVTAGTKKFVTKDKITLHLDLDNVWLPVEWKKFQLKIMNQS